MKEATTNLLGHSERSN